MKPKTSEAGVPLLDIDRLLEKLKGVEKMLEYQLGSSLEIMAEDMHEEVGSPNNYVTIRTLLTLLLWMREDTVVEPIEMNLKDGDLLILGKKALTEMKKNVGKWQKNLPWVPFLWPLIVFSENQNQP